MPSAREITEEILGAWDDVVAEEENVSEEEQTGEPEVPLPAESEPEAPAEDEPEEEEAEEPEDDEAEDEPEEEQESEDEGEEAEAEEEGEGSAFESDDVEVRAFLAKYNGDVAKALKGAAELSHLINRQGQEKNAAIGRVAELEAELERARLASSSGIMLNEEQRSWVEEATNSGSPGVYVQHALDAGEFDLARAVCHEWAREDPYSATRAGQRVDEIETAFASYREPVNMPLLLGELAKEFPDMPVYTTEMTGLVATLGDGHPYVQEARSMDVATAARGIVGIYELAKATKVNTRSAKEKIRREQRENGASARKKAVVSSGSASPSAGESPRPIHLGPGLTLEALEAEFAKASASNQ